MGTLKSTGKVMVEFNSEKNTVLQSVPFKQCIACMLIAS